MPTSQRERDRRWAAKNPVSYLCAIGRSRAKKIGVPFTITPEELVWPKLCPIMKIPLTVGRGCSKGTGGAAPSAASLDRIDPTKGYVPGNVQIVSMLGNLMKQNATPEQLRAFANWVRRTQRK